MAPYKKPFITLLCLIIVGIVTYISFPELGQKLSTFVKSAQYFAQHKNIVEGVREELFSGPLRGTEDAPQARLTVSGVITLTNAERAKEGLVLVTENARLNAAAQSKLDDMFAQQYFEHISPQGNGPGYLAEQAEYSYIIVGENLALGNFKDDAALVAAWMASPGHRANIMHTRFTEIGVAVGEGMYNGKKTWLAVQEFGSPLSACPAIDTNLKARIDHDKSTTTSMSADIEQRREELKAMPRSTASERETYNTKVDEYNDLVIRYDAAIQHLKNDIDAYNKQVQSYNACLKG